MRTLYFTQITYNRYDKRYKQVDINIVNAYNQDKYYVGSSVNEEK